MTSSHPSTHRGIRAAAHAEPHPTTPEHELRLSSPEDFFAEYGPHPTKPEMDLRVMCVGCGRLHTFRGFDWRTLGEAIVGVGWVVSVVKGELEGWCKACADARPGTFLRAGEE